MNGDVKTENENTKRRRVDGMEGDELLTQLGESEVDIRQLLDSFKQNPDGTFIRMETERGGVEESKTSQDAASELLSHSLNSEQPLPSIFAPITTLIQLKFPPELAYLLVKSDV